MNRKEWIDEMILKSKQLKYERQKEKDKTLDLTEELDKEWRQIQPLINTMVNRNKKIQEEKEEEEFKNPTKPDDYDVYVKSLMFDNKATVRFNCYIIVVRIYLFLFFYITFIFSLKIN